VSQAPASAGASISPRARLITGLVVAIAGTVVAAFGVAATWFTVTVAGTTVDVPDVGRASILGESFGIAGTDVAGGVTILAVLALLAAGLAALAGARARVALLAIVIAASLGAIVGAAMVDTGDARAAAPDRIQANPQGVTRGFGRDVTIAGAAVAVIGAGFTIPSAGKVARVPMPEGAPTPRDPASA